MEDDFSDVGSPELRSDLIRLNLLYRYGGVWLDASVVLLDRLPSCDDDDHFQ